MGDITSDCFRKAMIVKCEDRNVYLVFGYFLSQQQEGSVGNIEVTNEGLTKIVTESVTYRNSEITA